MKKIIPFIIICTFLAGCSKNKEDLLEDAIIVYSNSDTASPGNIARGIVQSVSHAVLPKEKYQQKGECLYAHRGDSIEIVLPFETAYNTGAEKAIMVSCSEDVGLLESNGSEIHVHKEKGKPFLLYTVDDVKDQIKSVLLVGKTVYFYRKHRLYYKSLVEQEAGETPARVFIDESFRPPYKKYYRVTMLRDDDTIGVIVGSAGYYYISAVSISQRKAKVTNITASSPEVSFHRDHVYYVFGGSGNWHVKRFDYSDKTKHEIRRFKEIKSIKFFSRGFIFKDDHGLWLQDYNKDIIKVPFDYDIAGKYGDMLLIGHEDKVYLVDVTAFKNKLEEVKLRLPDLFT